jgi:hypothetical protein
MGDSHYDVLPLQGELIGVLKMIGHLQKEQFRLEAKIKSLSDKAKKGK